MTLRLAPRHPQLAALGRRLGRALEPRWVQALLFLGVFLAAWLVAMPTAHAA